MATKAPPRKSGGGTSSADKIKLLIALGLFLIAGLVFAWYSGYIGGGGEKPPPPTPAQEAQMQESQKIQQKEALRKDVIQGSS
jgi:hypothetical protein